jgi:xanthine dehydrogenase YagR molybdenum-binding subunit
VSQTSNKPPAAGTESNANYVGRPLNRIDGRLKVTGAARYAAEFDAPELAHAVLVQTTIARGRVTALRTAEAEAAPGVLAVITFQNMPSMPQPSVPPAGTSVPLLSGNIVYSGQNIAVVVAQTLEQAQGAARMIQVEYAAQTPDADFEKALDQGFVPNTAIRPGRSQRGDIKAALDTAAVKVEQVYRTPSEHHNPMEPHATLAVWRGDKLTVYDATQGVTNTAQNLAELFRIAPEDVHVINPFVGGGFGCKGQSWPHTPIAALAARVVNKPVKLVLTRRQMFTSVGHRPRTRQENTFAARRDGHLVAIKHEAYSHTSQTDEFMEPTGAPVNVLYACPNVEIEHRLVRVNVGAPTYQRAPGEASGSFGQEVAMDELAIALNMDPVELRMRNYAESDESKKQQWSSKSLGECYELAAERFGWSRRNPRPGSMRDGRWLVGYGMATATYPANFRPAGAKARMYSDGRVWIGCGTQDLGTGTYTILAQIAADTLGVPLSKVRVEIGDSWLPNAPTSGGSCSATSAGSAVQLAARALRNRVLGYATSDEHGPLFNLKSSELSTHESRVFATKQPAKAMTYEEILARYGKRMVEQEAFAEPGLERGPQSGGAPQGTEQGDKAPSNAYSMQGFGAQFCEVRVDPELGIIRVARWVGSFGLGKVLNAKTLISQLQGGIVWGIGMALEEDTLLDERFARYVNTNLAEYHVPVNADVPQIDIILVDEEDRLVSPLGAKGAGEIGITGAAAAVCNAVYHATGKRVRDLPITLDKLI